MGYITNVDVKSIGNIKSLRTGVGCFGESMHRWGMCDTAACKCAAENQTADHILFNCKAFPPPQDIEDLSNPNDDRVKWLQDLSDHI